MRKKTSISIDEKLWKEWIRFVVNIRGSTRKISEEVEKALLMYMEESHRFPADKLREILGVREVKYDVVIPENFERKILEFRRKRVG